MWRHAIGAILLIAGVGVAAPRLKDVPIEYVAIEYVPDAKPRDNPPLIRLVHKLKLNIDTECRFVFPQESRGPLSKDELDELRAIPIVKSLKLLKERPDKIDK
jgi:hypothetical protein